MGIDGPLSYSVTVESISNALVPSEVSIFQLTHSYKSHTACSGANVQTPNCSSASHGCKTSLPLATALPRPDSARRLAWIGCGKEKGARSNASRVVSGATSCSCRSGFAKCFETSTALTPKSRTAPSPPGTVVRLRLRDPNGTVSAAAGRTGPQELKLQFGHVGEAWCKHPKRLICGVRLLSFYVASPVCFGGWFSEQELELQVSSSSSRSPGLRGRASSARHGEALV